MFKFIKGLLVIFSYAVVVTSLSIREFNVEAAGKSQCHLVVINDTPYYINISGDSLTRWVGLGSAKQKIHLLLEVDCTKC